MRKPTFLFDASSLVKAMKETRLAILSGQAIQWLTVYEVLNALWKEAHLLHRLHPEEASSLTSDFSELVREMIILEPKGVEEDILEIALTKGLTSYDSSYIALAKKYDLTLVTEDKKLRQAARGTIKVTSFNEIT